MSPAAQPSPAAGDAGFSLVELLIAMLVTVVVLGSAVGVVAGVQNTYRHQLDDVTVEQEARFALDFIRRTIEPAGSFPYPLTTPTLCTPTVASIWMNPDGVNGNDDIRIMSDAGIPDGFVRGPTGDCTEPNEDVTIAHNPASGVITRYDRGTDAGPVAWTDSIFTGLLFEYFDASMAATASPGSVSIVRVTVTGRSRQRDQTGQRATFVLSTDVRLRTR